MNKDQHEEMRNALRESAPFLLENIAKHERKERIKDGIELVCTMAGLYFGHQILKETQTDLLPIYSKILIKSGGYVIFGSLGFGLGMLFTGRNK